MSSSYSQTIARANMVDSQAKLNTIVEDLSLSGEQFSTAVSILNVGLVQPHAL